MIPRYTRPKMGAIWTDENRFGKMLEVEIALKQSAAQGGQRVNLPLTDRSAGLEYDWHR